MPTIHHLRRKMRDGLRVFTARRRSEQVEERVLDEPITEWIRTGTGCDDNESDDDGDLDKMSSS
jgi:hypothetical protein